jgi:hypothetical protein
VAAELAAGAGAAGLTVTRRGYPTGVHETADDLASLQDLLDRSHRSSGAHLRSAFDQEHRLSASELVAALPGIVEMHLAVVTGAGAPLVAPVDAFLFRGKVCFGLPAVSVRTPLLRRDPRISASFVSERVSFILHGTAVEVTDDHPWSERFEATAIELAVAQYGEGIKEWLERKRATDGTGYGGIAEPRVLFAKG